jgi:hypothetical protein
MPCRRHCGAQRGVVVRPSAVFCQPVSRTSRATPGPDPVRRTSTIKREALELPAAWFPGIAHPPRSRCSRPQSRGLPSETRYGALPDDSLVERFAPPSDRRAARRPVKSVWTIFVVVARTRGNARGGKGEKGEEQVARPSIGEMGIEHHQDADDHETHAAAGRCNAYCVNPTPGSVERGSDVLPEKVQKAEQEGDAPCPEHPGIAALDPDVSPPWLQREHLELTCTFSL